MESFFARYKNPLVLALVLLAQFVLLAVQVQPHLPGAAVADQSGVRVLRQGVATIVTPPEKVLHHGGLSLRGIWSSYVDLVDVRQQNEELRAENQRLQLEQAGLSEDAREGERLQEMLAFKQHYIDTTVPAQVIGTSGSDHGRILYINKGSDDGVQTDMPVITPDGIVGRVRSVEPGTSQVLAINDPTSAAGALLEDTRTRGVVRGDGVGHTEIVDLMPDSRIKPGQIVLTSGGDRIFPRGLPVGTVERIVTDVDNAPLVDVILKPAANLGRLEEVMVITSTGPAPSAQTRRDLARSVGAAAALKLAASARAADAAEAALEAQSASDILAARLPSANNVFDADAPDAVAGASPATADSTSAPLHPPSALHPDHYTPGSEPPAQDMTPGSRLAPLAEGVPPTDRPNKTAAGADAASPPSPSESAAFLAAHNAALAARPHAAAPKPVHPAEPAALGGTSVSAAAHPGGSGAARSAETGATARPATSEHSGTSAQPVTGATPAPRTASGGTAPRPAAGTRAPGAAPEPNGTVRRTVPTQVITDGPLPATHRSTAPGATAPGTTPRTQTPRREQNPGLVPDDGSRPPATSNPQPNSSQGPH